MCPWNVTEGSKRRGSSSLERVVKKGQGSGERQSGGWVQRGGGGNHLKISTVNRMRDEGFCMELSKAR